MQKAGVSLWRHLDSSHIRSNLSNPILLRDFVVFTKDSGRRVQWDQELGLVRR
jgi:hypothetical protein